MATAKKCKHCGEWMEPQVENESAETIAATTGEPQKQTENAIGGSIPTVASVCMWMGILCTIFQTIQGTDLKVKGGGKWGAFVEMAHLIPEEVLNIIDGIAVIGLLLLLKKVVGLLKKEKSDTLLNLLCGSAVALYGINTICLITKNDILEILGELLLIPYILVLLGLGIKLAVSYQGPLRSLGIGTIIWAVSSFLFYLLMFIAAMVVYEGESIPGNIFWPFAVITSVFYYVFVSCIEDVCKNPQETSNWRWYISAVSVIVGFVLMGCL